MWPPPLRFQPRSEVYDGTASPHGYHTEKEKPT